MTDKQSRAAELVRILNEASNAYYLTESPTMTDAQWDELYDELASIEAETGEIADNSPTRRVGAYTGSIAAFEPHEHLARLWSLDKTTTREGIAEWAAKASKAAPDGEIEYIVEYKFDGLTVNLTYDGGKLVNAATRGDGRIGETILDQVKTIKDAPRTIPFKGKIEVQGEAIMSYSALAKYNETAAIPLKNPRNGASGALRNIDATETKRRNLTIFFYQVGYIDGKSFATHDEMICFLRENGFNVSAMYEKTSDIEEVYNILEKLERERDTLDFQIDGAVVKLNDYAARAKLGATEKFPRWAIAYKFKPFEAITKLESVTWEVGRTGKLTPLAHLAPVDIAGVTIRRATLNNAADIERKGVRVGCDVRLRRSGDVIPEILSRANDQTDAANERDIVPPETCPACGERVSTRGALLYCGNPRCKPKIIATLANFASRQGMDIEGLSEATLTILYDNLGVRSPDALYRLDAVSFATLPGFARKKAESLAASIEQSKTRPLAALIYALSIPNVGVKTARDMAAEFGSIDALMGASAARLVAIGDVGDIVASSILEYFADEENIAMIQSLKDAGVNMTNGEVMKASGAYVGETVVITGTLGSMTRQQAEELLASQGAAIAASVTKKTTLVVAGEAAGSKLAKAQGLGITIYNEEEMLARVHRGA